MSKGIISEVVDLEKAYRRKFIEDQQNLRVLYHEKKLELADEYKLKLEDLINQTDRDLSLRKSKLDQQLQDIENFQLNQLMEIESRLKGMENEIITELLDILTTLGRDQNV